MGKISSKRMVTRLRQSPLTYIILVVLGSLFVYSAIGAYSKSRIANEKLEKAEEEFSNLEDQKRRLTTEIENANTPFGQEKALREKFNVVKDGEQVIMIVTEDNQSATTND